MTIALAIDGPLGDSATGEDPAVAIRPMLTACILRGDLGFASELADPSDDRIVEHSASLEVFDQCGQGHVGRRDQIVFQTVEVIPVGVPEVLPVVVPIDRNNRDTMFDQTSCHQDALAMDVATVSIPSLS